MTRPLLFNLTEMLNLLALAPSLFAIISLIGFYRHNAKIIVPIIFLLSLCATFALELAPLVYEKTPWLISLLTWVESLQPAFCFLLIMQLWLNKCPAGLYWLILALPVFGGTSVILAGNQLEDVCIHARLCMDADQLRQLYQIFATCAIFLLLIVHLGQLPLANKDNQRYHSHRYWLILALIGSYTLLVLTDLLYLANQVSQAQQSILHVVLRLAFIYLTMTSLLRVFDTEKKAAQTSLKPIDQAVIDHITHRIAQEKLYREMNLTREQCAARLEIQEYVLSRALNQAIGKNFNEFINHHRVEEAKQRLISETTPVTVIAFEVGFSSIASFNRVFKQVVGQSPSEYRAQITA